MAFYTIALLVLGGLAALAGGLMQLIAAFRQSIWWGLAALFVPFASMVFVVVHWAEAKAGFLVGLLGSALLFGGVATAPAVRAAIAEAVAENAPFAATLPGMGPAQPPAKDLNAQIQEKRDRIEQLEAEFAQAGAALVAQFQALNTRRTSLRAEDAAAVAQFNTEAAAYQTQNTAQKQRQQDLAATHQVLEDLLAQRAKQPAPAIATARR